MSTNFNIKKGKNDMDWEKRFEIIKKKIEKKLISLEERYSHDRAAAFLETSTTTYNRWLKGKDVPDGEALKKIAEKLNLSPYWLLFGTGKPDIEEYNAILTCDIHIADTLCGLIQEIDRSVDEIAITGGLYPAELNSIIIRAARLPSEAIQKWIHAYKINANFLLAQIGDPFLTQDEYNKHGILSWVRDDRGDNCFSDMSEDTYYDHLHMSKNIDNTRRSKNKEEILTQRIKYLEEVNIALKIAIESKEKLIHAQEEAIHAQKESLSVFKNKIEEQAISKKTTEAIANFSDTAARSLPKEIEP
jgi:transcriptional regulator with XRE-family HTH domain